MSNKSNEMKEINLKLNIDEVNQILEGLGAQPFNKVFALIGKIQQAAAQQLSEQNEAAQQDTETER